MAGSGKGASQRGGQEPQGMSGTTASGFEFSVREDALNDYELFEALGDVDSGDVGRLPFVIRTALGEEQKDALVRHIKERCGGRADISQVVSEFKEILDLCKSLKK